MRRTNSSLPPWPLAIGAALSRVRFLQPGSVADLALAERAERLACDGLDDQADERCESAIGDQRLRIGKRAPTAELTRVLPVTDQSGAVREHLSKGRAGDARSETAEALASAAR